MEKSQQARARLYTEVMTIALAAIIAFSALVITSRRQIVEKFAEGAQNGCRIEQHEGVPYTACSVKDIKSLVEGRVGVGNDVRFKRILWLGNSQLHYVNQCREGDHLAPYWLRDTRSNPISLEPLGCSLPNATFQEFLVLSSYVAARITLHLLIVDLVFDDLREDGLRGDFSEILTPTTIQEIRNGSKTAEVIIQRYLAQDGSRKDNGDILAGTIQRPVERWLNDRISASWKLWADRPQIEGNFFVALYYFRNWSLGIKPTTVRKMIPSRYELNMNALRDMLDGMKRRGIPVLLYIAPIRQDKQLPYNTAEYARWKDDVGAMSRNYNVYLVNLEKLVPDGNWGSYMEDIDFMHFKGAGHRLVAEALLPYVEAIIMEGK